MVVQAAAKAKPTVSAGFVLYTLVAATVTAASTWVSTVIEIEIWAMFTGFVAWFTSQSSTRDAALAMVCLWLGMAMAVVASIATAWLTPYAGSISLPIVVFFVACTILGIRKIGPIQNLVCWFMGLVAYFAAGRMTEPLTLFELIAASAGGGIAGWVCQTATARWQND